MKATITCLLVTLSLVTLSSGTQAGFVADFIDEARNHTNVTKAGIVESAALNTVAGGAFAYRAPRKSFTAFSVSPPSLKAGCGGIDIFLGAFSLPSKEEFLSFLRSVGTAMPGLAFQLALQTMAPDLNEQVSRFTDLIRDYTNRYTDSCQAASALLEHSGAREFIERQTLSATNYLRSSGAASDQAEADWQVRDHGGRVFANAPQRQDGGGNVIDAPEINLTWALLAGSRAEGTGYSDTTFKELLMTLVGTTVYTQEGDGADAVPRAQVYPGVDLLPQLFGEAGTTGIPLLSCRETKRCLVIERKDAADIDLVARMQTAADHYLLSLKSRDPALVTDEDLLLLAGFSSVPVLKVLNLAALSRYEGLSHDLVRSFVQAAAYEALVNAVESLTAAAQAALAASSAGEASPQHAREMARISKRLQEIRTSLYERNDRMVQQMVRAGSLLNQFQHVEKALRTEDAAALQAFLPAVHAGGS